MFNTFVMENKGFMKDEDNIFVFGKVVSDDNFIDRTDETARMKSAFENGINVILSSRRRMGKTSLVKAVRQQVDKSKVIVIYMDIFACRSDEDFYKMFLLSVIRQTSSKVEEFIKEARNFFSRISTNISVGAFPDPSNEMSVSFSLRKDCGEPSDILNLPEKIALRKGRRVVVCIDEFQQIGDFPDSIRFQKILRSVWQHQKNTSYCLFGSKRHLMDALFLKRSYPFYKFGAIINLGIIGLEYWVEYICRQFKSSGKEISEDYVGRICSEVDNLPSYIQELAWLVWVRTPIGGEVSDDIFSAALNDLTDENTALFQSQTANLSSYQMNFLRAVKDGVHTGFTSKEIYSTYGFGTPANVSRIKKTLLDKELIEIRDGEVYFSDPVLLRWFT